MSDSLLVIPVDVRESEDDAADDDDVVVKENADNIFAADGSSMTALVFLK